MVLIFVVVFKSNNEVSLSGVADNEDDVVSVMFLDIRDFDFDRFCVMIFNFEFSIVDQELSFEKTGFSGDGFEIFNELLKIINSLKIDKLACSRF